MTEEEKEKRIAEILAHYENQIEEIRHEFRKSVQGVLDDIHEKKMEELEEKLGIYKRL
jgi:hypothetical protein